MADAITIKALQDASLDAKSLEEVVNGNESKQVTTRKGETYPSVKKAITQMFENGGLPAIPFATKALMTASALVDDKYAMVTDDTVNNGLYVKTAGAWVKSDYDPLTQSKAYTDLVTPVIKTGVTAGNLITNNVIKITDRGLNHNGTLQTSPSSARAIVTPVMAGQKLYINKRVDVAGIGGVFSFFANDPITDTSQSPVSHSEGSFTDAASGIEYFEVVVPNHANYLVINTEYYTTAGKFTWAVHLNEFIPSFDLGRETVVTINGKGLITDFDLHQLSNLMYSELGHYDRLRESTKNLYDGVVVSGTKTNKLGISESVAGDCVTPFVPVTAGQSYTISGLDMGLQVINGSLILGFTGTTQATFVKELAYLDNSGTTTVLIDDPTIKYIVVPITSGGRGTVAQANAMPLQVELGVEATAYEPYMYSPLTQKVVSLAETEIYDTLANSTSSFLSNFVEMNKVRSVEHSTLGVFSKDMSPVGIIYNMKGVAGVDNTSNNLFSRFKVASSGVKQVSVNIMKYVNDVKTLGVLNSTPFTVPSGVFDNPNGRVGYDAVYPNYAYVHPSIDYNATGVAGFKYWMIASSFASSAGDALWEDEDLFVSNDAKTWQRVRSLYETDKSYTTDTLRLPPHDLAKANSRQYAFLPCPPQGTVLEMSMPANNGGAAVERQTVTLTGLPWKHDPFLMIDGGYVYTYHTFLLPYADRDGGKNKFIVCVRTDNGIDWDVVRSDGSTMRLTEESSKTLFTKSADGKYNFIHYVYNDGSSNPEIIKYDEGDYEFIYGSNFSRRFKGTTPYTFDFETIYPIQEKAAGNHPTLFLHDGVLNLITNDGVFYSTDRGVTFSNYPYYPLWFGGHTWYGYKKSTCVGDGGKLIVCDVERISLISASRPADGQFSTLNDVDVMSIYEYASVNDFINKATEGLVDAYIDVQIEKINYTDETRVSKFIPSVSLKTMSSSVNNPLQRIKVADLDCKTGDDIFFYITLNSRNGAEIQFGGIDIT